MIYPPADELEKLYPAGTPLKKVHPDFRGMPFHRWRMLKITEQFDAIKWTAVRPLEAKAVATGRDSYGKKSSDVPVNKKSERPKISTS